MKVTIVGLITPHILRVVDLANQAEAGVNVDWHLKDAVAKTTADLAHLYNAHELLSAFIQGLQGAAEEPGRVGTPYANALQTAAAAAAQKLRELD